MPGPTTLTINLVPNSVANVVSIAIPSALQSLDSTAQGSVQSGYSSADVLIRSIFKAHVFTDGAGRWFNASQIISITAQ